MSSAEKTKFLGLNKWKGSDTPQMSDFLLDNVLLDTAIGYHKSDSNIHITPSERRRWDTPYCTGSYMGDGASSRNIALESDFTPSFGLIFAVDTAPFISDYQNKTSYAYFAFFTQNASSSGVSLKDKTLSVTESSVVAAGSVCKRFNESGTTYIYILFR